MTKYFLLLFAVIFSFGCMRPAVLIDYHHRDPKEPHYWMTVTEGTSKSVTTSFWYCLLEGKEEPVCKQAKLIPCDAKTGCKFEGKSVINHFVEDAGASIMEKE